MRTNISPILNLKRAVRTDSISIITGQTVKLFSLYSWKKCKTNKWNFTLQLTVIIT